MGGDICRSSLKKKHYFNLETGQLFAISSFYERKNTSGRAVLLWGWDGKVIWNYFV